jgi:hypothetical protein
MDRCRWRRLLLTVSDGDQLRTLGDKGGITQLLAEHAGQGAAAATQIRAVDYRA